MDIVHHLSASGNARLLARKPVHSNSLYTTAHWLTYDVLFC